ncbi:MAG: MipA/OmpV family protein [Deltaproteobacteria bacterium]|nr:MipA/OmpV family protein [Deltaproteobacteria bacterium]
MHHRTFCIVVLVTTAFMVFGGTAAAAPPQEQDRRPDHATDWSVRIGAMGIYTPAYEGSDEYELRGFPLIDVTFRDTFFVNAHRGVGAYVWNRDTLKLGISVGYAFGRDEDDSDDLRGLGNIDDGATANVLFAWTIGDADLDARYEEQITGHDTGFQVHLGLGYAVRIAEETTVKPLLKTTFASSGYMEEHFGVSPGQSARSGMPGYDAGPGFKSFGLHIMVIHRLDRHWGVQAGAGYDRLIGEAAGSPVVKDENQYRLTIGLSYLF